ncbi:MAG: response regulator transcription factor [Candidatus Omnitrophica bacterium]|nr:response regulator transcription factor [Candidatus Omnitrophota bacterium]
MNNRGAFIYVVDDDSSVTRALSLLLISHGFRVKTFENAESFIAFKTRLGPSCLVLDVQLPDIDGLVLQEKMAAKGIEIPIVFITGHGDIPMSVKGMKGGAVDFLPKPFTDKELLDAIDRAIDKSKGQNKKAAEISVIKKRVETLSPKELEVFRFVAKGMLSKQIAYKRGISLQTIKVHRSRVMKKMQAKTVTELIHFAQKAGITPRNITGAPIERPLTEPSKYRTNLLVFLKSVPEP